VNLYTSHSRHLTGQAFNVKSRLVCINSSRKRHDAAINRDLNISFGYRGDSVKQYEHFGLYLVV
jgi:hypothetical protein